jgi:hypothetical protein
MGLKEASISDGSSRAIQGAGIAGALWDAAVTTTKVSFDLTAWQGRMVIITISGDARYRWGEAAGDTLDVATEHATASTAASTGANIGGYLTGPGAHHKTVPYSPKKGSAQTGLVYLHIAAKTGTIDVCIEPG